MAAAYMDAGDDAVPAGAQFPDGRTASCDDNEWPAFIEAVARVRAADRQVREFAAAQEPCPKRKITAPFGGGEIEVDATEPSWLGTSA